MDERGRSGEDQLLDCGDLLAEVVFLELDELGLYVFYERIAFGTLELRQKLFCHGVS